MLYDLHCHSTASDGTLSPSELIQYAHKQGVNVLALTDHDTTEGLEQAQQTAASLDVHLINGVEISVSWAGQTVHILGLDVDPLNTTLQAGLSRLRDFRGWRAQEIGRRLGKAGIDNAYEGAQHYAKGNLISRTHFARFLVETGYAKDMGQVFKKYLVQNKPGHVAGEWAGLEEVLGWIRSANGYAVIAHPARYRMSATKLRKLIEEFKEEGGQGIEVVSGSHSVNDRHNMAMYAKRYDLYASMGSDYHGPENPWIDLGRIESLPASCRPIWQLWQQGEVA